MLSYNLIMFRRLSITLSSIMLLTACVSATPSQLPTRVPLINTSTSTAPPAPGLTIDASTLELASPTIPELSPSPTATSEAIPTDTLLPLPTINLPPTQVVTAIPKPSADSGIIQFLSPGPLSRVSSPFIVYGYAIPGFNDQGNLQLFGENGHLLSSKMVPLYNPFKWANFYTEMSFDISYVGELGRLTLSTKDVYGRVNAVNSIHLLLLSEGTSIINQPGDVTERCSITQPVTGQRISGGDLTVAGKIRPFNNLPLTLELVDRNGNIVGTQLAEISTTTNNDVVPFRVDMHYSISKGLWALLTIRQNDDRIGGLMYLFSEEFYLNP